MRKLLLVTIPVILVGCATQQVPAPAPIKSTAPLMPPPPPKCINIPGEGCKKISAGNVGGTTLGNHDEITVEEDRP